ncbi:hypothetical protein NPIL_109111 [Nephila pilipes]|uniref:Uncharacterized protein n=1 Tax=Nephila pilipes TaxID=299642 RepID=A0A8X6T3U0_NEPPI|nr:hypothetical protein NPIL_109111 [Nephila pilipes]
MGPAVDGLPRPSEGGLRLISSSNSRNTIRGNPSPDIGSHHSSLHPPLPHRVHWNSHTHKSNSKGEHLSLPGCLWRILFAFCVAQEQCTVTKVP